MNKYPDYCYGRHSLNDSLSRELSPFIHQVKAGWVSIKGGHRGTHTHTLPPSLESVAAVPPLKSTTCMPATIP